MCVCTIVYKSVCVHAHPHTHACMHAHVLQMCVRARKRACVDVLARVYTRTHVCMRTCCKGRAYPLIQVGKLVVHRVVKLRVNTLEVISLANKVVAFEARIHKRELPGLVALFHCGLLINILSVLEP